MRRLHILAALLLAQACPPRLAAAPRLLVPGPDVRRLSERTRYGATYHAPSIVNYLERRTQGSVPRSTLKLLLETRQVNWQEVEPFERVATAIDTLHHHPSWRTRRAAVQDLLWRPSARVEEALIRALRDPMPAVRDEAVKALARVGTNRSLKPLMRAMHYTPGPVRDSIAVTLRNLTGEDFGRHLDRWQRWYAANRDVLR